MIQLLKEQQKTEDSSSKNPDKKEAGLAAQSLL